MRQKTVILSLVFAGLFILSFNGTAIAQCHTRGRPIHSEGGNTFDPGLLYPGYDNTYGLQDIMNYINYDDIFDGNFSYSQGHVKGNYVNFDINETTGTISNFQVKTTVIDWSGWNYTDLLQQAKNSNTWNGNDSSGYQFPQPTVTYDNVTIFDSVTVSNFTALQKPTVVEGLFLFHANNVYIFAFDSPSAFLFYVTTNGTSLNNIVTFHLSNGISAKLPGEGWSGTTRDSCNGNETPSPIPYVPDMVWIEGNNVSGSIFTHNSNINVTSDMITLTLGTHSFAGFMDYSILPMFEKVLGSDVNSNVETEMKDAVNAGRVGAEITIGKQSSLTSGLSSDTMYSTQKYDSTLELMPLSYDSNKVEVKVSSTIPTGRVVLINVQNDVMSSDTNGLTVNIDGQPVTFSADANGVLYATGSSATANIVSGSSGLSLIIYIPHFSTHTITLEKQTGSSLSYMIPVMAGAAVTIIAFLVLIRRRKR